MYQETIVVETSGRGAKEITHQVQEVVNRSAEVHNTDTGLCHLFIQHTSASLILCENADPDVPRDIETFMIRAVPDGDPAYRHQNEGPDDMSAHIRTILTSSCLTIPVSKHRCMLGTWQGIFLWEHRSRPQARKVTITVQT